MPNIYFTADLHLGHHNIIKFCGRPFQWIGDMNEAIIENWNKTVHSRNDLIYVLGDFGINGCRENFARLKGKKFLIKGNHDRNIVRQLPWEWVKDTEMLSIYGEQIWLSHYPHRSWKNSIHGSWHLYGHTHGKLPPYGKSFDIGVDCWQFKPVHFEEVKENMKEIKDNRL